MLLHSSQAAKGTKTWVMAIESGRVYRSKQPRESRGLVNDRIVLRLDMTARTLQYNGPAVGAGRKYATCTWVAFRKWAACDVTDLMPHQGEWWQPWPKDVRMWYVGPDGSAFFNGTLFADGDINRATCAISG